MSNIDLKDPKDNGSGTEDSPEKNNRSVENSATEENIEKEKFELEGVLNDGNNKKKAVNLKGTIKKERNKEEQEKLNEEKYKEEQRQRMRSIVIGARDYTGNTITKIFSRGDEYAIYEIKTATISDSIKVLIDTEKEYDETLTKRFDEVRVNFSKIKGLLYKVNDDTSVKTRIAHIMAHALCGQTQVSNNEFINLINEINQSYREQFNNRLRYLITILLVTLVLIVYSIYIYRKNLFVDMPVIRSLIFVVTAGSMGGVLSVSRRLRKTIFEKDVHAALYIIYGFERAFIAISGAVILYFAMKSNLAFGTTNEFAHPVMGYVVFSIVAGFSETLIPNLLVKLESDNNK